MNNIKPWLFKVDPYKGESLSHFLGRLRRLNYLSPSALGKLTRLGGAISRWEKFHHNPFPSEQELQALGNLAGYSSGQLREMLPSSVERKNCNTIRLCSACYGDSPYHRLEWQYQSKWKCERHNLNLLSSCPQCSRKFSIPSLWQSGCCEKCRIPFRGMKQKSPKPS
jgi:hypothetical protein